MAQYADCYCLVASRDATIGIAFLDKFLPDREASAVDYPVPRYVDAPQHVFTDPGELMLFLAKKLNEKYSIYWRNIDSTNVFGHGMLFYTDDGKMIVGVSVAGNYPEDALVIRCYKEVKKFLNSEMGCITIEEPPPLNAIEFKDFCSNRYIPI